MKRICLLIVILKLSNYCDVESLGYSAGERRRDDRRRDLLRSGEQTDQNGRSLSTFKLVIEENFEEADAYSDDDSYADDDKDSSANLLNALFQAARMGGKGGMANKGKGNRKSKKGVDSDLSDFPTFSPNPTISPSPFNDATVSPFPTTEGKGKMGGKGMMGGKGKMKGSKGKMGMMGGKGKGKGKNDEPSFSPSPQNSMSIVPSISLSPTKSPKSMKCKKKGSDCTESPTSVDFPSFSPQPSITVKPTSTPSLTFQPTPSALTAQPSPIVRSCEPTTGTCLKTDDALKAELAAASLGDVVSICSGATIEVNGIVDIVQDSITLCCDGIDCTMASIVPDSVLFASGQSVTLQDIRFVDGFSDRFNGGNVAIEADGNHVIIGCSFANGATSELGGNLFVRTIGSVTIEDSEFENGLSALPGGGLAVLNAAKVTIRNSLFIDNKVGDVDGGGFYTAVNDTATSQSQDLVLDGVTFIRNNAGVGGGFSVFDIGPDPSVTITNSVFTNNNATAGGAGTIAQGLDIVTLTLSGNSASGNTAIQCPELVLYPTSSSQPECAVV